MVNLLYNPNCIVFLEDLRKAADCGENELLTHLSQELQKYTFSPIVAQQHIVARELIKQFPNLKSNIGEGDEEWVLKMYDSLKHDAKKEKYVIRQKQKVQKEELKFPKKMMRTELEVGNYFSECKGKYDK